MGNIDPFLRPALRLLHLIQNSFELLTAFLLFRSSASKICSNRSLKSSKTGKVLDASITKTHSLHRDKPCLKYVLYVFKTQCMAVMRFGRTLQNILRHLSRSALGFYNSVSLVLFPYNNLKVNIAVSSVVAPPAYWIPFV